LVYHFDREYASVTSSVSRLFHGLMTDELFLFKRLLILIVLLTFHANVLSDGIKSVELYDSLVIAADSCLEKSNYQCAKDAYVHAYQKGMSRDSLAFLIAALYEKKGNFDTALIYNLSCTTSTSILFPAVLDQRKSILDARFDKRQSDMTMEKQISVTQINQQKGSFGFSLLTSYLKYRSNEFPFIQEIEKLHDALALEAANSSLSIFYDYLSENRTGNYVPHFKFNLGGITPLDSTFFSSDSTKNITAASEISIRNKKNSHAFFNKLSFQYNFKTVAFSEQIFFDAPVIREKWYYMPRISGKVNVEDRWEISETNIGGSLFLSPLVKSIFQKAFGLLLSYTWKENETYFNYIQGNTDSVIEGRVQTLYFDQDCTTEFGGLNFKTGYWTQLAAKPLIIMPGQTVDITSFFKSVLSVFKVLQIEPFISLQGQYFIKKVQTLTLKNKDISFFDLTDRGNVVVLFYNKQNDNYYYCKNPDDISQWILSDENLVHFEKMLRFDVTILLQNGLRYTFKNAGELAINGWCSKTFSTLDQSAIAIPLSDYNWGINTEWKLQFGVGNRAKKN
jgi:hypothetical protein